MNLDWYYTFLVLSKHLNYHRASEELFLTEPALHHQIKKLEKHLQVTLFETSGRKLRLTPIGCEFVSVAKALVNTYEEGVQAIRLKQRNMSTHIKIVVSPYIAAYLLPKFLSIFFERQPFFEISVTVLQNEIALAVENHKFDIGISREKPYTTKIHTETICEGRIDLFYPKCDSQLTEMELLQKYKILSDNHPVYWSQVKQEISERVPEARFISIRDISMTEKLIEMEQGISYLPAYLNAAFDSKITSRQIEEISTPVSFTYLITNKKSEAISYFCQQFKDFILSEQNRVQ